MNLRKEYIHCTIISNLVSIIISFFILSEFSLMPAKQLVKFIIVMVLISSAISLFWALDFKSKTRMVFPNE